MENSCEPIEQPALLATFYVRNSLYALEAAVVQEVVRLGALTPVHYAPPEVVGVINLRGRIVTVLDIGLKLGLAAIAPGKDARVFIIDQRDESIGLLTDRVSEVVETDGTNIDPLPANIPQHQARFFRGVCRTGGRVITWLDASAF
jgi:purine-binding chemotaxis protein CheW